MCVSSDHQPPALIAFSAQPVVLEKIPTHLGLWPTQAESPPRGYPFPSSGQRAIAASSRPPLSILLWDPEHSRRDGCLPAAPFAAASPRSHGVRGTRRGFLLDTRPRPAVPTRSVGQRQADLAGEASAHEARPPRKGTSCRPPISITWCETT